MLVDHEEEANLASLLQTPLFASATASSTVPTTSIGGKADAVTMIRVKQFEAEGGNRSRLVLQHRRHPERGEPREACPLQAEA